MSGIRTRDRNAHHWTTGTPGHCCWPSLLNHNRCAYLLHCGGHDVVWRGRKILRSQTYFPSARTENNINDPQLLTTDNKYGTDPASATTCSVTLYFFNCYPTIHLKKNFLSPNRLSSNRLSLVNKSYVSPIACRCCPISLMMSLSVRDISLTAGEGSDVTGCSLPFKCVSEPFICKMSSASDSCSDDLRLPALRSDNNGGGWCCIVEHSRSFFAGGGVQTVDDGVPSTSLSDEEARLAMRPSTGRATGP